MVYGNLGGLLPDDSVRYGRDGREAGGVVGQKVQGIDVRIMARMPALIASGNMGHAAAISSTSFASDTGSPSGAPDSAPPTKEIRVFPLFSGGISSPLSSTFLNKPLIETDRGLLFVCRKELTPLIMSSDLVQFSCNGS